jgi:hypothetical protein
MNKTALAFGIGASLILAAGAASAADSCAAEVAALQQKIGMEEGANATTGPTDPGVQQPSPTGSADTSTTTTTSPSSDQVANTDNSANATIGATDSGAQQPAPEANATTGTTTATDGSSTTTADNTGANATIGPTDPGVQQPQNTDATADSSSSSSSSTAAPSGTVTETSRAGDLNTAAGGHAEAITALKKAQLAADAGDEATCMTELGTAKAAMGVQ